MNPENIEKVCQSVFDAIIQEKDRHQFCEYDGVKVGYFSFWIENRLNIRLTVGNPEHLVSTGIDFVFQEPKTKYYGLKRGEQNIKDAVKYYLQKAIEKLKTKTENPETKEI
jgi:hypothetical protein